MNIKDVLTQKDLAKKLNITEQTISQWRAKGMPYVKIGKLVFILQNSFLKWMKKIETTDKEKKLQDAPGDDL